VDDREVAGNDLVADNVPVPKQALVALVSQLVKELSETTIDDEA